MDLLNPILLITKKFAEIVGNEYPRCTVTLKVRHTHRHSRRYEMATITITDITPVAVASGWAEPVSTALIDSPLFQHKLAKGDVIVSVLAHRNGVIADASRVNSVTGSFVLVGETAPLAEYVLQWLQEA